MAGRSSGRCSAEIPGQLVVHREHLHRRRAVPEAALAASRLAAALVLRHALRLRLSAGAALRHGAALDAWACSRPRRITSTRRSSTAWGSPGVYLLCRRASGSRGGGAGWPPRPPPLLARVPVSRRLSASEPVWLPPQRLGVLVRYGEGPHMTRARRAAARAGLRVVRPAAGAARRRSHGAAAVSRAGGLEQLLRRHGARHLLSDPGVEPVGHASGTGAIWLRAAAIAALAYGLTAFWLTPSYLRVTLETCSWSREPGNTGRALAALALAAGCFAAASSRAGQGRERAWPVFVAGAVRCSSR